MKCRVHYDPGSAVHRYALHRIRETIVWEIMPMKNPPHVGRVIWHGIFAPLGLSISKAAGALGVRRATLSDLINGKAALTAEMALRIHKAFGPVVGHLLRMQAAYEAARISKRTQT